MKLGLSFVILYSLLIPCIGSAQELSKKQNDTIQAILKKSNAAYDAFNYNEVIEFGAALIEKAKEYDSDLPRFLGYDIIGGAYLQLDDTLQSRVYSEKALAIAKASKVDSLIAWGSLNLGILYSERPETYQKAVRYFKESIKINQIHNNLDQVYHTYINLGWTQLDHGEVDKAYDVLKKAKAINEKVDIDPVHKNYVELLLGRYFLANKNYNSAIQQFKSVAKIAETDSIIDQVLETYEHLIVAYEETKDYKNAYESIKIFNSYKNKAYTEDKYEASERARAKFDLKQAQKNLNTALREKQYSQKLASRSKLLMTIFSIATIILFFALFGFYLFFNTRKKFIKELKIKNKELKAAKEKAEKLSKIKTRFLSTVSHELRTPLYGVIGISTLLKEDNNLNDYKDDLESLKFSADYLLALVNDVLLLSKVDAEAIKLSEQPFKLDFLIQNIVRSFEYILQKNNNKLHVQIDEDIPNALLGDATRLSQVLINLIGNAAKFTQNGNIWLALALVKITNTGMYRTCFTIKDDGPGIPMDKQKVVFEEFSQIEDTNQDYKGTGLGLTIVKKLLKLYKSKIHLASLPGQGAEFSFSLNLAKDNNELVDTIGQDAKEIDFEASFGKLDLHILIVDDNSINQKITQKY